MTCFSRVIPCLFVLAFVLTGKSAVAQDEPADDGLAAIIVPDRGEDEERLFQALHGARLLAESGAGYEAARVLATLATRARHREAGREAAEWLREFELTVEDIRTASPQDINAKIADKLARHRGNDEHRDRDAARHMHVRNLVALRMFEPAAQVLLTGSAAADPAATEQRWGDLLHHYRIPVELLIEKSTTREERIVALLQRAQRREDMQREIHSLWAIDHEAAEVGHRLLEYLRSRNGDWQDDERDEGHWGEHHENPYAHWVERPRHEREERDRDAEDRIAADGKHGDEEDDQHDELNELASFGLHRAIRLAKRDPRAARLMADLIVEAAPESLSADSARALLKRIPPPAKNLPRRRSPEPISDEDPGATLFTGQRVRDYHLALSDEAIQQLHENPKEYVRGTFREGDQVFEHVGVRLKGSWGSFRMIDGRSKAAFTVKFNQFDDAQRFHGLRRIVLNNGEQDPSYLHEYAGYELFRSAGIPAPRIAFANLTVNKESYGFYVQVEAVTQDFLARWFRETDGNLYEGPGDVTHWRELDLDSNQEQNDRSDLRRLAEAIEQADEVDPWSSLRHHVDIGSFARFVALEQMLSHWDGYTQTNNYRLYHDPTTKKFHFFPHGCDQLFEDVGHNVFRGQAGILGRALLETETGRSEYRKALRHLLDEVWAEDRIRQHIALAYPKIRSHVISNRGKSEHNVEEFEHHIHRMLRFVALRRLAVEIQLRRIASDRSWRDHREHDEHLPSIFHREHDEW